MKLREIIDIKAFQDLQDAFSNATGLAAIAVDNDGSYITEGSNFTDFCMKYTRATEEGCRRCVKCDNECTGTYFCHAGLMDFSCDIIVNGEKVGAIIGGQVLPVEPDLDKFRTIARELGINEEEYVAAVKKVPVRSEASIRAAAEMLKNMINQMVNMEYIQNKNKNRILIFDEEVVNALKAVDAILIKTKELEKIASKQNMLTLNATIEAARAGEAGAGFTVVAKQMGSLAKSSSEIYKEMHVVSQNIARSIEKMKKSGI